MANRQKFTRGSLGHMLAHFERKQDKEGNYYTFGNQDIDQSRSHMNYNLAAEDQPLPQLDFLHKRMKDENIYLLNRKNVNVMMTWCLTLPQKLSEASEEDKELFFKHAYEFMKDRYGKENVISAWVHRDETSEHMHFAYTPVCYDLKKQRYTFNAKVVGSKKDLSSFHKDLDKHLTDAMGYETGVITGETEINLTIKELKELTKRQNELQEQIEKSIEEVQSPHTVLGMAKSSDVDKLVEQNKLLKESLAIAQKQNTLLEAQNKRLEASRDVKRYLNLKKEHEALKSKYEALKEKLETFIDALGLKDKFKEFSQLFISREQREKRPLEVTTLYYKRLRKFSQLNKEQTEKPKTRSRNTDRDLER